MTVSLFTFVDMFSRAAGTADNLLSKGAAHAETLGVSEAEMLGWRLIDDMATLRFQVTVVGNFAGQWPARAAGLPAPPPPGGYWLSSWARWSTDVASIVGGVR